ncbi:hypothetical protein BVC80_9065g86 [Macleaya cordata]|uniref:Uncharacterized protein n=1 Tax=Macleaya cordata TaxID=56857 RepID=A0A200PNN0_MACCD|nr:hypothetical protein BVC80_9065g86 [Macleaya cordata]
MSNFSAATKEERKHGSSCGKAPPSGQGKKKRVTKARATTSFVRDLQPTHLGEKGVPVPHPYTLNGPGKYYGQQMQCHPRHVSPTIRANREAFNFSNHEIGSSSAVTRMPLLRPYSTVMTNPRHHAYANPGKQLDPSSLNRFPDQASNYGRINSVPSGPGMYRMQQNTGYLPCSTPGCRDQRDDKCFGFSCWRCCRRTGRRCHRHQ